MEGFFRTHKYLIEHIQAPVRRILMDEINWNDRLIGIKGSRGVGKTTFLLQYAKEYFRTESRECLYINMNNFYFQGRGLYEFAGEFYRNGGKVLLVDQVFKEPDWSRQLRRCYDNYKGLKIVFTGSSVMRLKEENPELNGIVKGYNLRGFSLREFINLKAGKNFRAYGLEEVLRDHEKIVKEILPEVSPSDYFQDYIHHGFYPCFLENKNYSENLLKTMNMMIEVDVLLIKQIDLKYLPKIKKLFYLLAMNGLKAPNVSKLAEQIDTSRATVMKYIKYLSEARLTTTIYPLGESYPKKPARVMMYCTNLMYTIYPRTLNEQEIMETFFINSMWKDHEINLERGKRERYVIDGKFKFEIVDAARGSRRELKDDTYYARYNSEIGKGNQIPIWLLGFLY